MSRLSVQTGYIRYYPTDVYNATDYFEVRTEDLRSHIVSGGRGVIKLNILDFNTRSCEVEIDYNKLDTDNGYMTNGATTWGARPSFTVVAGDINLVSIA